MAGVLLDTTALLCHWFDEPGASRVDDILATELVFIAAVSEFEFVVVATHRGIERSVAEAAFGRYSALSGDTVPITQTIVRRALALRAAAKGRIPTVDCLIAGVAAERGLRLVHRDEHLSATPVDFCVQEKL
ncbi:MAG: PIN domain-containing protein [Myxococcales bacterium]|nr:PIN domain-containing protein [Myxococcales bacterium]